jgi:uncharacterized SAM-binding protein YcdF (DUF218 family)
MNPLRPPTRRPRRVIVIIARILVLAGLVAFLFIFATAHRVIRQATHDETRRAGAIVVFGAAEYAGRPSPVLRARLDHAFELWQEGFAPFVITTGGAGADPHFSEGGVGRDYLRNRGIPDRYLIAETLGGDTAQSAERVAIILKTNGIHDCLAVSDAYHMYRIKRLMRAEDIISYASPRPGSFPKNLKDQWLLGLREGASYLLWKLGAT